MQQILVVSLHLLILISWYYLREWAPVLLYNQPRVQLNLKFRATYVWQHYTLIYSHKKKWLWQYFHTNWWSGTRIIHARQAPLLLLEKVWILLILVFMYEGLQAWRWLLLAAPIIRGLAITFRCVRSIRRTLLLCGRVDSCFWMWQLDLLERRQR